MAATTSTSASHSWEWSRSYANRSPHTIYMLQDYRLRSWGTHLQQHTSTTMKGATFNIDQWVDLNTYTNSKDWKGCCYRNRPFSIYRANKIVSIFIAHFGEHLHRAVIVSNLFRIKEQRLPNSNIGHYVKYIEKYLIDFGYLKLESNAIYNHANCFTTGFKTFQQPGADIVAMFSLLVVMHDAIDGHCFLCSKICRSLLIHTTTLVLDLFACMIPSYNQRVSSYSMCNNCPISPVLTPQQIKPQCGSKNAYQLSYSSLPG